MFYLWEFPLSSVDGFGALCTPVTRKHQQGFQTGNWSFWFLTWVAFKVYRACCRAAEIPCKLPLGGKNPD